MTLEEQLLRDEGGYRLRMYRDSEGFYTIGVGHCLDRKQISRRAAEQIFRDDLADAVNDVAANLPWSVTLNEPRLGVLQAMCFNMGIGGLMGFRRMLTALEVFDYEQAAVEMLDSRWARQVGARAERLAFQMRSGVWQ